MKSSLYNLLATVAMPAMLVGAVGCGGSSKKTTTTTGDMAKTTTGSKDMTVASGCDEVGSFTATIQGKASEGAFYDVPASTTGADYDITIQGLQLSDDDDSKVDVLVYQYYHLTGDPATALPLTTTYSTKDNPSSDAVVTFYVKDVDPSTQETFQNTGTFYAVQGGSTTATKLDNTPMTGGAVAVTGSTLHFVEWDFSANSNMGGPASDGACLDVSDFSLSANYAAAGADAGT